MLNDNLSYWDPHSSSSGAGNGLGGHISVWSPGRGTCLQRSAWVGCENSCCIGHGVDGFIVKIHSYRAFMFFASSLKFVAFVLTHTACIRTELFKLNHRDVKMRSCVAGRRWVATPVLVCPIVNAHVPWLSEKARTERSVSI